MLGVFRSSYLYFNVVWAINDLNYCSLLVGISGMGNENHAETFQDYNISSNEKIVIHSNNSGKNNTFKENANNSGYCK